MPRTFPPLNALRTFEAAARHLSFTRAGAELHVTQSAVSHQMKALEQHLGVRLFRRFNRALVLTEPGQAYLASVREALDRLEAATARLRGEGAKGVLNLSLLPTFLARWLIPRLPDWQARHPEIELRMETSMRVADFARDGVDVAVRFGRGRWPGVRADLLFNVAMVPLCSPGLMGGDPPLRAPADLAGHRLLHDTYEPDNWPMWLRLAGVTGVDASRGLRFEATTLALAAAAEGVGVALGHLPFIARDLAEGRLVAPFDIRLSTDIGYWVACAEDAAERPRIKAFREWLIAETAADRAESQETPVLAGQLCSSGTSL